MAIPPEVVDLLICCASVAPGKGPKLEALISKGVDWTLVIAQGHRHDILPLLYWSLKTHCPDKVPDPIRKELGEFFQANARKNLFTISELLRIVDGLKAEGIKAIPFKGPVLTSILYGNPALRCYGDLDILINPRDFHLATQILEYLDYGPVTPIRSPFQETILLKSACEYSFYSRTRKMQIDLHWGIYLDWIYDPRRADQWWQRTEETFLGNESVITLSPEDLLLLLAIHGSLHGWSSIKWISDLAKLLETRKMDWSYVFRKAAQNRCRRMTFTSILLANKLLLAPVPDQIRDQVEKDKTAVYLAKKTSDRIYSNITLGLIASLFPMLLSNDHFLDRLRYALWVALTPRLKDGQALSLPYCLHFLYYLVRPVRLFITYILGGLRKKPDPIRESQPYRLPGAKVSRHP
jgi:hypothetical protein